MASPVPVPAMRASKSWTPVSRQPLKGPSKTLSSFFDVPSLSKKRSLVSCLERLVGRM